MCVCVEVILIQAHQLTCLDLPYHCDINTQAAASVGSNHYFQAKKKIKIYIYFQAIGTYRNSILIVWSEVSKFVECHESVDSSHPFLLGADHPIWLHIYIYMYIIESGPIHFSCIIHVTFIALIPESGYFTSLRPCYADVNNIKF